MAPKNVTANAKGKALKKPAAWVEKSNSRKRARKDAIVDLNSIAVEIGATPIRTSSPWRRVQKLITSLQSRLGDGALAERLRDAALAWQASGGHLQGHVVTAAPADMDSMEADHPDDPVIPRHKVLLPHFRIQSHAFMCTYNARSFTVGTWPEFHKFTKAFAKKFGSTAWGACLEETLTPAAPQRSKTYHVHNYFYWDGGDGVRLANTDDLVFQSVRPRVDTCTVTNPLSFKTAAMHGLWYVATRKKGGVSEASNYAPWRNYTPRVEWLCALWGQHKLDHEQYEQLSAEFRVGHASRMHDLAAVRRTERAVAIRNHLEVEAASLPDTNTLTFKTYAEVEEFIGFFHLSSCMRRRPVLVIAGETNLGKSMLGAHVLQRVADNLGVPSFLEVTVEGDNNLDLSEFDVATHAGVLLDGVGDALMLHSHREALQGRVKECRGGKSATMVYSYPYTLCRRAVVVTMDLSASNLAYFTEHPWLSDRRNVIALRLREPVWA